MKNKYNQKKICTYDNLYNISLDDPVNVISQILYSSSSTP